MSKLGKLIVIDGADGAGKATQSKLLVEKLLADNYSVKTLDFPQYTQNHFGKLIRECLDGKHGDFLTLDPRIASTLYIADRMESANVIKKWLHEGSVVVLDRYASSNMLHQGSKITDEDSLREFIVWLDTIEFEVFKNPRPDLVIYLEVPYSYRQKMLFADVTRNTLDVLESDVNHQQAVEKNANRLTKNNADWYTISCVEDGKMLSPDHIHAKILNKVRQMM